MGVRFSPKIEAAVCQEAKANILSGSTAGRSYHVVWCSSCATGYVPATGTARETGPVHIAYVSRVQTDEGPPRSNKS